MSAPIERQPRRGTHQRRGGTGGAVAAVVLLTPLAPWAGAPPSTTPPASPTGTPPPPAGAGGGLPLAPRAPATVPPRTDAGAAAALLLADRYTALADSASTLRAARESDPTLADVPLDEFEEGTTVERAGGTATIHVRVQLAARNSAVAAANAVV